MMAVVILAGALAAALVAQTTPIVSTVESVDLARYVGDWFEIARFPNRFQRGCAGDVRATYARRADGRIDVINRCCNVDGSMTSARGVARVVDPRGAKLKVRFAPAALSFLPFVWGDYWVIGLDPDYRWAVVGTPDHAYLWILSRTATMDEAVYKGALARATANGFDTDRLVLTPQSSR